MEEECYVSEEVDLPASIPSMQVIARLRPTLENEGWSAAISAYGSLVSLALPPAPLHAFAFDGVHGPESSQECFYKDTVEDVVRMALRGHNVTILAYGSPGSGKTHTLFGPVADPGIATRCVETIFSAQPLSVEASFVEIYNEQVFDLLGPSATSDVKRKTALRVKETSVSFEVVGVTRRAITASADFSSLLQEGEAHRAVIRTVARSHTFLTLRILADGKIGGSVNIVDLISAEFTEGLIKETTSLHHSLTSLVSPALVHSRGSKLTQLLRAALGKKSKIVFILCLHPSLERALDTLQTLRFSSRWRASRPAESHSVLVSLDADVLTHLSVLREEREQLQLIEECFDYLFKIVRKTTDLIKPPKFDEDLSLEENESSHKRTITTTITTTSTVTISSTLLPSSSSSCPSSPRSSQSNGDVSNDNNSESSTSNNNKKKKNRIRNKTNSEGKDCASPSKSPQKPGSPGSPSPLSSSLSLSPHGGDRQLELKGETSQGMEERIERAHWVVSNKDQLDKVGLRVQESIRAREGFETRLKQQLQLSLETLEKQHAEEEMLASALLSSETKRVAEVKSQEEKLAALNLLRATELRLHEEKVASMTLAQATLNEEKQELVRRVAALAEKKQLWKQEQLKLAARIEVLSTDLQASREAGEQGTAAYQDCETRLEQAQKAWEAEKTNFQASIADLQAAVAKHANELNEHQSSLSKQDELSKEQRAKQAEELNSIQTLVATQSKEISMQQATIKEKSEELSAAQAALAKQTYELTGHQEAASKHANALSTQQKAFEKQCEELTTQREMIERQAKELSSLNATMTKQAEEVATYQATAAQLTQKLAAKREALAKQAQEMAAQQEAAAKQLQENSNQKDVILKQTQDLNQQAQELATLQAAFAAQTQELTELQTTTPKQIRALEATIAEQAQEIANQKAAVSEQNQTFQTTQKEHLRELSLQKEAVAKQTQELTQFQAKLEKQEQEIAEQKETISKRADEFASLQASFNKQTLEVNMLKDTITKQIQQVKQRTQEISSLQANITAHEREVTSQKELVAQQGKEIADLQSSVAAKAKELEEHKATIAQLTEATTSRESALKQQTEKLDLERERVTQLSQDGSTHRETISQQTQELSSLQASLSKQAEELAALKAELMQERNALSEQQRVGEEQKQQFTQKQQSLEQQLASVRQELTEAQASATQNAEQLDGWKKVLQKQLVQEQAARKIASEDILRLQEQIQHQQEQIQHQQEQLKQPKGREDGIVHARSIDFPSVRVSRSRSHSPVIHVPQAVANAPTIYAPLPERKPRRGAYVDLARDEETSSTFSDLVVVGRNRTQSSNNRDVVPHIVPEISAPKATVGGWPLDEPPGTRPRAGSGGSMQSTSSLEEESGAWWKNERGRARSSAHSSIHVSPTVRAVSSSLQPTIPHSSSALTIASTPPQTTMPLIARSVSSPPPAPRPTPEVPEGPSPQKPEGHSAAPVPGFGGWVLASLRNPLGHIKP